MGTLTRFAVKNAIFLAQKPLPTNSNATNVLLNFKRLSQSLSSNVSVVSLTRTGVEHRLENRISSSSFLLNEQSSTTKSNNIHLLNGVKIESAFLARQFINTLDLNERQIIKEELIKAENELKQLGGNTTTVLPPSLKQLIMVSVQNGLPFIGFGFVDNFLMIVAGDIIESYIGLFLPISTMAAAGLGNAFSDVAGIGLAHHIEYVSFKLIGEPNLSPEQYNLRKVHWVIVISKSLCIFIGCVIGMFPLLFINHSHDEKKKSKNDNQNEANKSN